MAQALNEVIISDDILGIIEDRKLQLKNPDGVVLAVVLIPNRIQDKIVFEVKSDCTSEEKVRELFKQPRFTTEKFNIEDRIEYYEDDNSYYYDYITLLHEIQFRYDEYYFSNRFEDIVNFEYLYDCCDTELKKAIDMHFESTVEDEDAFSPLKSVLKPPRG
jgi:hypothetical protein